MSGICRHRRGSYLAHRSGAYGSGPDESGRRSMIPVMGVLGVLFVVAAVVDIRMRHGRRRSAKRPGIATGLPPQP
jgi:hypothetical protein